MYINYVETFLLHLQTEKNSSELTIESYVRDLRDITSSNIRKNITHLYVLSRALSTINRMICALKTFFKYLVDIERVLLIRPRERDYNKKETFKNSIPLRLQYKYFQTKNNPCRVWQGLYIMKQYPFSATTSMLPSRLLC